MSDATLRAIDDAIQAHLADESSGHIATGWVAYVAAESMTDATKSFYQSLVHESQPYHSHARARANAVRRVRLQLNQHRQGRRLMRELAEASTIETLPVRYGD